MTKKAANDMMLLDLARRWNRKLQIQKGTAITAAELALMTNLGMNDILQEAVATLLRDQCRNRTARSQSINGGRTA